MADWVEACAVNDVDEEDVIRFDHGGRTFAIYRSPDDDDMTARPQRGTQVLLVGSTSLK